MVSVHRELLSHLGIGRLFAVIGGSLGGMQALAWFLAHPDDARKYLIISATSRASADNIAWNSVARAAIRSDPDFNNGLDWASNVIQGAFQVESYLEYRAARFVSWVDANSYLYLSSAMDTFDAVAIDREVSAEVYFYSFAKS